MPKSQRNSNFLVSKRWLNLQGRLVRSLKLLDWKISRIGSVIRAIPKSYSRGFGSWMCDFASKLSGYPNLRKLMVVSSSELGLLSVAEECPTLQELELHRCTDQVLRGIAACQNLQILKLIGNVDGFYVSLVSDIGLTILAQGCRRLVKLELSGCEGSYDGIRAIGQCCQMLEELTLTNHRMEAFGSCPALERLHLERCQLRDKQSVRSLFLMCETVREIVFQNCWGLDNDLSSIAGICRRVKFLSLEGCSLLTTQGLESMLLSWKELQRLRVVACNNIKDGEVTPMLSILFSSLKELMWRPDTKSQLLSNLAGTGMGKKGGRFFKKM
ncbi:RNI-like superfamily protein [Actinidia rufa]|uniref:RNI-like superfamily protein n=1 Tax=Actinidia rufa TaxID=165716 RepID=A0A7J0GWM9_9ERIC|nr:RNI-like superfamily protein [Actinidia rufa]